MKRIVTCDLDELSPFHRSRVSERYGKDKADFTKAQRFIVLEFERLEAFVFDLNEECIISIVQ